MKQGVECLGHRWVTTDGFSNPNLPPWRKQWRMPAATNGAIQSHSVWGTRVEAPYPLGPKRELRGQNALAVSLRSRKRQCPPPQGSGGGCLGRG